MGGGFDGDAAAHAVAVQVEVVQAEVVNEFEDGAGMGRGCVGKVARAFAVAAASEVKQDGAAASKGRVGGNARVFVAAGTAEAMHKEAGWGMAGQVVIGEVAAGAGGRKGLHGYSPVRGRR